MPWVSRRSVEPKLPGLADIAELLGELQQANLGADNLLFSRHVVQPETILRWHRAGFTAFWRWKSRKRAGRPKIARELRDLIRRMSKENPKWGASRIHADRQLRK